MERNNPQRFAKLEPHAKVTIQGFGDTALDSGDWKNAVNCLDYISENGILENKTVMEKLAQIRQADKTAGLQIASAIQARVNIRKSPQTPEPTLTPVPPAPSQGETQS